LTVEQIVKEPEMVSEKVRSQVADDMSKMGLEVVSFTIREIRDESEYILNMGRPDIAAVKRQADIATAEAERDIAIKRAQAAKEARIAEALADQETTIAQTASQVKQSEAVRDLEVKKAEYATSVKVQQAGADKAYEIQTNIEQQRVIAEQVKIEQVKKQGEIAVQEAEILRREKELIATVLRAAEIEKKRIETIAEANRQKAVLEATGQAESAKLEGEAQAEVTRVRGLAEAEIIRAKGDSEAAAMKTKAGAYQDYNQAAIVDRLLAALPEVVRAFADPLNKIDKITVVSTGSGGPNEGVGINKVTSDMATMIAQAPALIESLTGIKIQELIRDVPKLRETSNGHVAAPVVPGPDGDKPVS
jgi:flotillin